MQSYLVVAVVAVLELLQPSEATVSATFTDADKMRPVAKVVTLLKDMLKQLEQEKGEDAEIYDKMVCWCKTNDKKKTKSIADSEARIAELQSMIEEYTATIAQLETEIAELQKEIAKNRQALLDAKALREKQIAEFEGHEKELLEMIEVVGSAVKTLAEHHEATGTFLQQPGSSFATIASKVQEAMRKHASLLQSALTPSERRKMSSFVQIADRDTQKSKISYHPEYAPQSGEIYGMLSQMKETFEGNLVTLQAKEKEDQQAYETLKAAKEKEILAALERVETKTAQLAATREKLAQAKLELAGLLPSLESDKDFLAKLKERCSATDKEYEERMNTRGAEMEAVTEALAILTGDEAQDTFSRTYSASFIQETSTHKSTERAEVSRILSKVAEKYHNPRLSNLAVRARLDAFIELKEAIDTMVKELLAQKADEITKKDACIKMLNENELSMDAKTREKKDLEAKIGVLEGEIDAIKESIEVLKDAIADLMLQLKEAGETRDKESKEFQATLADQHATQKLLGTALTVLEGYYGKVELVQQSGRQAPPAGFTKPYEKQDTGVLHLISEIIKDSQKMSEEAKQAESDAAAAYEAFAQATSASIEAKNSEIVGKSQTKATKETDLIEAKKDLDSTETAIEKLASEARNLHGECDYLLKNFDIRQQARDEEVEALNQAKAILGGAKFTLFLQGK